MLTKLRLITIAFTLVLSIVWLAACSTSSSTAWLEGDWKSEEWAVTYSFDEKEGSWTISDGQTLLSEKATFKQDGRDFVLEDQDGTQFRIEKIDDNHIYFQQVAAEGLLGTTASVTFIKVEE